jgi:hypothetical protein
VGSNRRLVRPRVEAGSFEVTARLFQQGSSLGRKRGGMLRQLPVDVVDAEADAFHVEGGNGARQSFTFRDDGGEAGVAARLQERGQPGNAFLSGQTMVIGHRKSAYPSRRKGDTHLFAWPSVFAKR